MLLPNNPTSYDTVLSNLSLLDNQLVTLGLTQFLIFNRSYIVVTRAIKDRSEANFFRYPQHVEQFTVSFAQQYFQAVNQLVADSTSHSVAWDKLLEAKSHPRSIQLLMGANAHINHDLPLTMAKFFSQEYPKELSQEIMNIDKLLIKSSQEIIALFDESHTCLRFAKRHLRFLYYMPILYMILSWRIAAYKNSKAIRRSGYCPVKSQAKSIRIANGLFGLGLLLRF